MGSIPGKMQALFLLVILLLPPEAGAVLCWKVLLVCDWGSGFFVPEEIIGGVKSKPHSRPYMAHLKISSGGYTYSCGGFLISQQFVLTAAHCKGWKIIVILGAHDLTQEEHTWQKLEVTKQFVHPNYNPFKNLNDIMLLKLQSKVTLTHSVNTVPLPTASTFIQPGRMCRAAGWGKTGVLEPTSDILREVKLRIMHENACDHYPAFNNNLQLCVGNPRKIRSAYKGDSGGPLLCAGVAQGIVSYGRFNAQPPAVFTRISPYVPWIKKILNKKYLRGTAILRESPQT